MSEKPEETDLPSKLLATRDRVKDVILPQYKAIGPSGAFAVECVIKPAIAMADKALKEHDAALMIKALHELESIKE